MIKSSEQKQKLTITFDHQYGTQEVSYETGDIMGDDIFWDWFQNCWGALGLSFIQKELDETSKQ